MNLHLIRHPKPFIEPGICYGQLDVPAENPALYLDELRRQLPAAAPVWTSPLQRCRSLAEALHPAPCSDARLMEMNFGEWEGRAWNEVPRTEIDAWAANLMDYAPPGGESAQQVQARALHFFAENSAPEMVLVTHAGVIRLLLSFHKKQALNGLLEFPLPYGGLTSLYSFCHI